MPKINEIDDVVTNTKTLIEDVLLEEREITKEVNDNMEILNEKKMIGGELKTVQQHRNDTLKQCQLLMLDIRQHVNSFNLHHVQFKDKLGKIIHNGNIEQQELEQINEVS